MNAMIARSDVSKAARELERMRGSLQKWLVMRQRNDVALASGPPAVRAKLNAALDRSYEHALAERLHTLLEQLSPNASLPDPGAPGAAVQLAQIAITGQAPAAAGPEGVGLPNLPWWPILIVGGLLLAITTAIRSAADVAVEKERYACIKSGACTDYGFWLKVGGAAAVGWFAWEKLGVGERVKALIHPKRRA